MTNDFDDFEEDNEPVDLSSLVADGEEAVALQKEIDSLDETRKALSARLNELCEKEIPRKLHELGLSSLPLANGFKIEVKDFMAGSLNKAPDVNWAKEWIVANGGSDLIKTDVSVEFGKSEHNMALSFAGELREKGLQVKVEEGIHPQTYASFGRDKLKEFDENLKKGIVADPIPFDKLGLYHGRKAKITEGKKK